LPWYFAYGSNLDQDAMRRVVGGWKEVKPAVLKGYRLVFNVYSVSWRGGVANVVEDSAGTVYGAAYLIEEEQLSRLDRHLGVPSQWVRRKTVIEVDGRPVEAFIYVGANPRGHLQPSKAYISMMLRGLKRLGYGEEVLEAVRKAAEGLGVA
jgi:cation transport regulator ChaC